MAVVGEKPISCLAAIAVLSLLLTCESLPPEAIQAEEDVCDPSVDLSVSCQLKASQCRIVSSILHGMEGGLMSNLFYCSNAFGVSINTTTMSNSQKSPVSTLDIIDFCIANKSDQTLIRWCILQASHLITPEGVLNREAIAKRFETSLMWSPKLMVPLTSAAHTCPEPVEFNMKDFFRCLKDVCLSNVPDILEILIPGQDKIFPFSFNISEVPTVSPYVAQGFIF